MPLLILAHWATDDRDSRSRTFMSIDNEVIPLESAMMDIPNISIMIRSCHDVNIVIIRKH